jgi:hypothetical protein
MSVAKSSLVMAGGTIASRILGFIRTVVLALTIGVTTDAADAFGVANQLPNNVYAIIAGGVLSAVLVPQIGEDPAGPWLEGAAVLRVVAETVRPDGRVEVTVEARPGVLTGAARGFVRLRVAAR